MLCRYNKITFSNQYDLKKKFPEDLISCSTGLLWTDFSCSSDDPDDVEDDPESEDELEDEDDEEDCFFTWMQYENLTKWITLLLFIY